MLTVLRRPQSCKLSSTLLTGYSITSNGYGTAVLSPTTSLSDGDRVLITNARDSYNGFWFLSAYGPAQFRLTRYVGGPTLDYTQNSTGVSLYKCATDVDWSCVHLPIVYLLSSNLWPVNASDSIRGVTGFQNDNGFVRLTLSGSISVEVLDWLNIQSTSEDDLDGPFQILTKWSPTQFTIDAPYSVAQGSPYTYATATAQKYYNSYHGRIRIYAGLNASHLWASLKPYELITELKLIPDDNGQIFVNVAETIKQAIQILYNRPNYDTAPYDLDRFCQFYIEIAEGYDVAGVPTLQSYSSDQSTFEGWAADAKNEFKHRYSGFLSDVMFSDISNPAKFLTLATRPVLFNGNYFDLSIIDSFESSLLPVDQRTYDANDNLIQEVNSTISSVVSGGLLRLPIDVLGAEVYQKYSLRGIDYFVDPTSWINGRVLGPANTFSSISNSNLQTLFSKISLAGFGDAGAHQILPEQYRVSGYSFTFKITTVSTDLSGAVFFTARVYNQAGSISANSTTALTSNGLKTLTVVATGFIPYSFEVVITNSSAGIILSLSLQTETQGTFSEEKRIDVYQNCFTQFIYLTWKNPLGGFDYWLFTGDKDYNINILETQEKDRNPYPNWDQSYGEFADTLSQEVSRKSRNELIIRSQNLTLAQLEMIKGIKISSLVQQLTSKFDKRTLKIDSTSFVTRSDAQRTVFEFTFRAVYTDELPSQSL